MTPTSRRGWPPVLLTLLILTAAVLAACNGEPDAANFDGPRYDDGFTRATADALTEGTEVRIADITDFEWDTLHVFDEATSAERIEDVVGAPVLSDNFFYDPSNLWVFSRDGEVVDALIAGSGGIEHQDNRAWGSDVVGQRAADSGLFVLREG